MGTAGVGAGNGRRTGAPEPGAAGGTRRGGGGLGGASFTIAKNTPVAAWCIPGDRRRHAETKQWSTRYGEERVQRTCAFRAGHARRARLGLRSRARSARRRLAAAQGGRVPQWRRLFRALGRGGRRVGAI